MISDYQLSDDQITSLYAVLPTVLLDYRYTSQKRSDGSTDVYAILLDWPETDVLFLGAASPSDQTTVSLLGYKGEQLKYGKSGTGMKIQIPAIPFNKMPCEWAWVLKITNLQ